MNYSPIISKILLSFLFSSTVLYRYGNWFRHHIIVTLVVLLAWFFSFLIIFALPLDIISTVFRQCIGANVHVLNVTTTVPHQTNSSIVNSTIQTLYTRCEEPWSMVPDNFFPELWRTVYWTVQCLTWLFMPMMQSYIKAGEFTIKGKLKSALIDNAIYYGSYLFICGILLIYLATKKVDILEWAKLKAIASSASNTWGLFLLVLLLGYALVEVPRNLWKNANQSYVLNHAYFKAAKLSSDKAEAEDTVDDVLCSVQALTQIITAGHPYYQNLETIIHKVPIELKDRMTRRQLPDDSSTDSPSEKTLIRLHKQVIKSLQVYQRTETQWNILVAKIFDLEDIMKNYSSRDRLFKHTFEYPRNPFTRIFYNSRIEWYWKCLLSSYTKKTLAILAGLLSVLVVWSEVTFFNKSPVLSIFAIIVNAAKENYDYSTIEILSTTVILYLCYCAYSTVLKIRLLNLYYLAPYHQTNEYSLIFSGMMLSRLTPPMCLNFLGLIHMDSHIIKKHVLETDYTQIMGHMDVIKIISDGFNVYFPMAILAFCIATYFSIGARLLSAIGFHQFIDNDDEITSDMVNEGKELIKREKRRRQRAEESVTRRKEFHDRFSTGRNYRTRSDIDTLRSNPISEELQDTTRANLLQDSSFNSKRYTSADDIDNSQSDNHASPSTIVNVDNIGRKFPFIGIGRNNKFIGMDELRKSNNHRNRDDDDFYDDDEDDDDDDEVDTRFPPPNLMNRDSPSTGAADIESRFGASTRATINERYNSANDNFNLDNVYRHLSQNNTSQTRHYGRVGAPPKGIFDDV